MEDIFYHIAHYVKDNDQYNILFLSKKSHQQVMRAYDNIYLEGNIFSFVRNGYLLQIKKWYKRSEHPVIGSMGEEFYQMAHNSGYVGIRDFVSKKFKGFGFMSVKIALENRDMIFLSNVSLSHNLIVPSQYIREAIERRDTELLMVLSHVERIKHTMAEIAIERSDTIKYMMEEIDRSFLNNFFIVATRKKDMEIIRKLLDTFGASTRVRKVAVEIAVNEGYKEGIKMLVGRSKELASVAYNYSNKNKDESIVRYTRALLDQMK